MERLRIVRDGKIHLLMPDLFTDEMPRSVVANTVDIVAQDMARVMAPLPTLDCSAGNGVTAADKKRAEKKNRIGASYWQASELATHMFWFADYFNSYGVAVFKIEPDWDRCTPVIRVEDPQGFYYRRDRFGRLTEAAKVLEATVGELVAWYPEHERAFRGDGALENGDDVLMELVTFHDRTGSVMFVPQAGVTLAEKPQLGSRLPFEVVEQVSLGSVPRGKFDDALYVQLARAIMAQYTLQAADQSVNSPTILPRDVTNLPFGAGAVIFTDNPGGAGRMNLQVPREVFAMAEQQEREVATAAQYTQARQGAVHGNIITGKGVEAMLGTFDTQLKAGQELFKRGLVRATEQCFELDRRLWPNRRKTIVGIQTGRPYRVTYVPSRDIGEDYSCEATYGFAAGMSPAQSMVTLLQLRGDDLIGRDTARQQLPFDIDPVKEQVDIDVQSMNDALKQGMMAFAQGLPALIAQGQDPTAIVMAMAKAIEGRQKGRDLYEAIEEAFEKPEPQEESPEQAPGVGEETQEPAQPPPQGPLGEVAQPQGQMPPGMSPTGRMQSVAPGQQGLPPGGMAGILSTLAEMRGGEPRMSAGIMRKRAIGAG